MAYLLGLDVGTSGVKALLINEKGGVLASFQSEYPLYSPYPLWSEQNPSEWWQGVAVALKGVIKKSGINPEEVVALGLTGQMHGSVFLDNKGEVIRPAILWNDQRTAEECRQITDKVGKNRLIEIAGNPALTGFQAPKILWLRKHEPEHYQQIAHILLPKDYIRLKLTGVFASDVSDAAGTLLLDLSNRDWSDEILSRLEIPRNWLPKVYEGPQVTGHLLPKVAAELGLPAGVPVIAGGGDNAAAAIGTGVVRKGVISSSIGTSGVLFAHSDDIALDPQGRLHTFCHAVPGKYHLMAVTLSAGGAFRWLRDTLRSVSPQMSSLSYDELTALASTAPPGSDGLVFLPYLTGERTPHLDPQASGAFIGLTARHGLAHLVRAVMEGVVYSLRDGLEIMRGLGISIDQIRLTGGGGHSPLWRQLQADIYGSETVTLAVEEGPAFGAALLAGVGAGVYQNVDEAVYQCVSTTGKTEPTQENVQRYTEIYDVYRGLYGALQPTMHQLANL